METIAKLLCLTRMQEIFIDEINQLINYSSNQSEQEPRVRSGMKLQIL